MRSSEYQKLAPVTENKDFKNIRKRIKTEQVIRLLHAGIGLATEAGELLDALKKHIFYGKPLDVVNIKEEVGDLFWYLAVGCDEIDGDFEDIMETNIAKLKARYGEKFSEHRATNRDLNTEREILETTNVTLPKRKKAAIQSDQEGFCVSNILHRRKRRPAQKRQTKRR